MRDPKYQLQLIVKEQYILFWNLKKEDDGFCLIDKKCKRKEKFYSLKDAHCFPLEFWLQFEMKGDQAFCAKGRKKTNLYE